MARASSQPRNTRVLKVDASKIGQIVFNDPQQLFLGDWDIKLSGTSSDAANLQDAALHIRNSDIPVAFPTETVYGLGADATRSAAVKGIYSAKGRPSDNPLIVHISSLSQLRALLTPRGTPAVAPESSSDPIPQIYHPLISRFWPGPLTILLPLPTPSHLAPEVTNSLPTVAVRMPSSILALMLIHLSNVPLAAPSANASSKPSPTTAAHVLHDLSGRIDLILDGGPCNVGVESTVVDGLTKPPVILRPGGISIDMLRSCPGWEGVEVGYKDGAETGVPRAPGMKYKHYSPNARVLLFHGQMDTGSARKYIGAKRTVGVVMTKRWQEGIWQLGNSMTKKHRISILNSHASNGDEVGAVDREALNPELEIVEEAHPSLGVNIPSAQYSQLHLNEEDDQDRLDVWTIALGRDTADIARGLFSALRELDQKGVDVIFVEGIDDNEGDTAAAVMNRLRKAAEVEITL
ncbi:hypothetical protein JMJ35_002708 [Cladonia borealis]|uniref:Threonylcarbamoyl-AMP synthase n=1 Tax=Cladonia borealis TaxID=184061 RepID=A0AA39R7W8_9LECA|nr:hypothetical protein JMJ35_002708 [Cladonia borealis]